MAENQETTQQLSRALKSRHVQLIAIGGTIGTGLFLGAGESIHLAGPAILLVYTLTGLMCFFLMRALGELLMSDLSQHSFIDFIDRYIGERMGFVVGWTYWVSWITIAMAEITAAGLYFKFWFPSVPQWVPGFVILIVLLGLNLITVEAFGETEFWFAIIKIAAIVALIGIGLVMVFLSVKTPAGHASFANLVRNGGFFAKGAKGFMLSFQMVVFAFVGIEMVGLTASETANPREVIPKAINDIPMRIIIFYVGALLVIMSIYPWSAVSPDSSPFVQVFQNVGIKAAAGIINFVVLTAAASACNSSLFTTGRMLYSLTFDGTSRFSKRMSRLSKHQVPANALRFSTLVIAAAVVLNLLFPAGVFTLISSIATTCFLFIWSMIMVAHLRYRKELKQRQQSVAAFHLIGAPFTDYLVIGFLVFVAIVMLFKFETLVALVGAGMWLIALYIFHRLSRKSTTVISSKNE
ncbi:amino acid permease [Furfurilactobacillus curtus]|uniref:Amino acid permease n=1 Tax=Furfurilactobacillus curtus TaxID=1746200 RepID=A0ABQ5JQF4_9LACO